MGSKLNQDPSSDFPHEVSANTICVILLTYKWTVSRQTNSHADNTFLANGLRLSYSGEQKDTVFIVEITHDKRGVMQGFTTNSDISNTKAKPECF